MYQTQGIEYGIPQGSIHWPNTVVIIQYMLPLRNVIKHHHVKEHFYGDDTRLYIRLAKLPQCTALIASFADVMDRWVKTRAVKWLMFS